MNLDEKIKQVQNLFRALQNKISLSCFDDKIYVLDNGIYTLAYFYKNSVTS